MSSDSSAPPVRLRYTPRTPIEGGPVDVVVSRDKPIQLYVDKVLEAIVEKQKSKVAVRGMGRACGRIAERVAKYALRRLPSGHGFRYTITTSEAADAGVRSQEFVLEFDPEVGKDVVELMMFLNVIPAVLNS
ncbi:hypothetical protein Pmar_PMAR009084 [Perkinsus marinus ATCC 50983]|uniref:DNA/RNA-binding protein Alba-like domain-containing protein n=1 Tax=Perkinsus marinus (strain ATCC 50983 / TXsc) TaxID=423536 RepID=C5LQ56_PERM5|nr:hypothetical protein Pmar_PMAR009084 [Perkinsus marinus ATCC 50983]EER01164.1 hypothetical protein Pmar_PMAR009084 [Perkinsus marinus ATCC 50983]|eukprot:XP_002768446.1 hypothetical protein Pmar_PMAR009084 [Perkinsus marinus ATCC 50983]